MPVMFHGILLKPDSILVITPIILVNKLTALGILYNFVSSILTKSCGKDHNKKH